MDWWWSCGDATIALELSAALAPVWIVAGRSHHGIFMLRQALELDSRKASAGRAGALFAVDMLHIHESNFAEALSYFEKALVVFRDINDERVGAWVRLVVGW